MIQVTQPLRDEHQALLPHIEQLQTAANAIGIIPLALLRQRVDDLYTFLAHELLPHAQAEERVLYPMVGEVMGAPQATATMSRDHVAIGRLVEELRVLRLDLKGERLEIFQAQVLRRILYSLFALVTVHLAKEEEVYLPLLDAHLTVDKAQRLFEAMERAAQEAKQVAVK